MIIERSIWMGQTPKGVTGNKFSDCFLSSAKVSNSCSIKLSMPCLKEARIFEYQNNTGIIMIHGANKCQSAYDFLIIF
jgi:hypothetical protein